MERRKCARIEVRLTLGFQTENESREGTVVDLSREGCRVECDVTPQEGSYIDLSLRLSAQEPPLDIKSAAVRWVAGREFGIHFLYMEQEVHARLDTFMDKLEGRKV